MVSAALEDVYAGATIDDSGRDGSWVSSSEPMPLPTLTITGSDERRSNGRKAVVVRTTPSTLTSNTA
jgi:hypothetical protein